MTKAKVDVKSLQATEQRLRRLMKMHGRACNFSDKLRLAKAFLKGKNILDVQAVGDDGFKIICGDGIEITTRAISRPGIHYEWDSRTVVSVDVGAGRTITLIDK